jgi:hypothetical protein
MPSPRITEALARRNSERFVELRTAAEIGFHAGDELRCGFVCR